jgi:hypothetical protein
MAMNNNMRSDASAQDKDDDFFHCESRERPKRKGKLLKKELMARGYDVCLSACYDTVARMYGFRHLGHLYESVGLFGGSPGDDEIRRIRFQVGALVEMGVSLTDAQTVVDCVRPTGSHPSFARQVQPLAFSWDPMPSS